MAFALTQFKAMGILPDSPTTTKLQLLSFTVTRGASDTAIDLNDSAGTFWTAVQADSTYGELAEKAQAIVAAVYANAKSLVSCEITASNGFLYRVNGAPAAATEYRLTNDGTYPVIGPEITTYNDAAPASLKIELVLALADNKPLNIFES